MIIKKVSIIGKRQYFKSDYNKNYLIIYYYLDLNLTNRKLIEYVNDTDMIT